MIDDHFNHESVARDAILADLKARWQHDRSNSGVELPSNTDRFFKPQANYFCGSGSIPCPICLTGKLKYHRSIANGHVHANCSTQGCTHFHE